MARWIRAFVTFAMFLVPLALFAEAQRDVVPLKSWPAPLYFQPSPAESREHAKPEAKPEALNAVSSDASSSLAATPAGSLVFVAMTPCRIADTRDGTFPAGFGPPSLVGNASRTFAIQSLSSLCPVPSIAQAYSFNVTAVPPGTTFPGNVNPSGALGHLTIWPTGVPQPVVSTLNSFLGTVVANAAIVPAGASGSVDVFVSQSTDLIIDINGYYAPQSGITLAQGTASAPSLSFAGDPGTGIYSSGTGTLNIATAGTSSLTLTSNGRVGIGTTTPQYKLHVEGGSDSAAVYGNSSSGFGVFGHSESGFGVYGNSGFGFAGWFNGKVYVTEDLDTAGNMGVGTLAPLASLTVGSVGKYDWNQGNGWGDFSMTNGTVGLSIGVATGGGGTGDVRLWPKGGTQRIMFGNPTNGDTMTIASGNVGIGTITPSQGRLHVEGGGGTAGYFGGNVQVNGCLSATNISCPSDERLKENITPLAYGLPEVLKLRPVTWQWKDATKTEPNLGLIAQDVEPVMPELVLQNADNKGSLGLNYMGLVPVTINAIRQQQAQIEDQQKRIAEQQQQIAEQQEKNRKLEERLVALEKLLSTTQPSTTDR
jgi:hypothetical protein